jgi:hypothetical protein
MIKDPYEWKRVFRYVIVQPSVKNVGLACESFADGKDGTRVFPGVRRLMAVTGYTNKPVVDALKTMRWLGFIHRYKAAVRTPAGGDADRYQICLPHDLSHIPMVDAKTGADPMWHDLTPEAQRVAKALGVVDRLTRERPDVLSSELDVLSTSDQVYSVPNTNPSINSIDHSASHGAGQRASSPADEPLPDDLLGLQERIAASLGDLTAAEESRVRGMLCDGCHPILIVRAIRRGRGSAA